MCSASRIGSVAIAMAPADGHQDSIRASKRARAATRGRPYRRGAVGPSPALAFPLGNRKRIDRGRVELFAGFQKCRRKLRMVWRVRVVLGFQCKTIALPVHLPGSANLGRVEEIARIELDARFGG